MTPEYLTQRWRGHFFRILQRPGGGQAVAVSRTGREAGNLDQRADQRGCGNVRQLAEPMSSFAIQ